MDGYCACGCGGKTRLAKTTSSDKRRIEGNFLRFLIGHHMKGKSGEKAHVWKGGKSTAGLYDRSLRPDHPRADKKTGYVPDHILRSEKALGHPLPPQAVNHHSGKNQKDNDHLVICENQGYHVIIHQRKRAFLACGHAHWIKCEYCHQYEDPIFLHLRPGRRGGYHPGCPAKFRRQKEESNARS